MRLGIAEIDKQTIAKELSDVSFIALDDFSADVLVCPDNLPILFGVELGGELGGIDQVTKHQGQLSSFSVAKRRGRRARFDLRGWLSLDSRRLCCLRHLSSDCLGGGSFTRPYEHLPVLIS